MGEGGFPDIFFLQGCKSNRKFHKGENQKWHTYITGVEKHYSPFYIYAALKNIYLVACNMDRHKEVGEHVLLSITFLNFARSLA